VSVRRDQEPGGVDTTSDQSINLVEKHGEVDDHAVADHRGAAGGEDARRQQVEGISLISDHDRMTGVVAALVTHHIVDGTAEQIRGLALALVPPLCADEHDRGHLGSLVSLAWSESNPRSDPAAAYRPHAGLEPRGRPQFLEEVGPPPPDSTQRHAEVSRDRLILAAQR